MVTKQQVQDKAREYVGTPFQHQGRLKKVACDCVGLPLMVAEELKLSDKLGKPFIAKENSNYSPQPLDTFVHQECQRRLIEKPIGQIQPGDVICLKVPDVPCHVAIVTSLQGHLGMIHAYAAPSVQKVVEHTLDEKWKKRIFSCFEFPGVE